MSGKPCGCSRKPEQDPDPRAQNVKGHLLC